MSTELSQQTDKVIEHFRHELTGVRSGRANPAMIEDVMVLAYGANTPLQQIAAINSPEPRLLVVQPWDPSTIKDIEKSLLQSNLGITPVVDGKIIRLPFPPMTEERRRELTKIVNEKSEQARVSLRTIRDEILKDLKSAKKDGDLSEDMLTLETKKIETVIADSQALIETITKDKINELLTI